MKEAVTRTLGREVQRTRGWSRASSWSWFAVKPASLTDCAEGSSKVKAAMVSVDCKVLCPVLLQEVFLDYSCWSTPWSVASTVTYAHVFFLAILLMAVLAHLTPHLICHL